MTPVLAKGPEAFRTISEASSELGVPQHMLRFWETKFAFIRPMKRAGGRRFYRPQDLDVLRGVRMLLQEEGYTIKGVQRLHKEGGVRRVVAAMGVRGEVAEALETALEAAPAVEDMSADIPDDDTTAKEAAEPSPPARADPGVGRQVLDPSARIRLAGVLRDLERTKGAIDDLLRDGGGA